MSKVSQRKRSAHQSTPLAPNISPALDCRLGEIEYWPVDRLVPYADNPRKHPERQIVALAASMQEFGIALPFLADEQAVLICGHARLVAARRLGMKEVPVLVARFWSKAQVRAYRLADNRLATLASWDAELLKVEIESIIDIAEVPVEVMGWSTGEIDVILDGETAVDNTEPDDNIPELPDTPVVRVGDLWLLGHHRLICGSSLDADTWDRLMAGKVAAMSLNDPPWNVPVNGHGAVRPTRQLLAAVDEP